MNDYIKYKRFECLLFDIEDTFDRLIKEGWTIIQYFENSDKIIIICGKKREIL